MKRKSQASRLGVLALALTLVTTCLTGGTMAKYVTEVTGKAKATVAAWSFKADGIGTAENPIDLGSTANRTAYSADNIMEGVIAPGTSGSFDIVIDGSGSEVGVDYKLKIAAADGITLPDDLTFTTNDSGSDTAYTLGSDITNTIKYAAGSDSMKKTITVKWTWAFGEDDTKDSNDNTYADNDWTLNITATGTQAEPTATVTP